MNDKVIDIHKLQQYLPHRYPFLLVDRVLDYDLGKRIRAVKNVTINEPFFTGHFPQKPVMPGVLLLEALAQASGILAFLTTGDDPTTQSIYYFAGIDKARFKRVVEPGDQVILEAEIVKARRELVKMEGRALVDGVVVCTAEWSCIKKGDDSDS